MGVLEMAIKPTEKEDDLVRKLAQILVETGLTEIEMESKGVKVRVAKQQQHSVPQYIPVHAPQSNLMQVQDQMLQTQTHQPQQQASIDDNLVNALNSPMVGTVYVSPKPGAAPFVKIGDRVKEGDVLLIIEAMKVMNPIPAAKSGIVSKIFVEDGSPVEFGQPLLILE